MPINNLPSREEFARKKRNKRLVRFVVGFFLVALLVTLVSYISHRPEFTISEVKMNGGLLVTEKEVHDRSLEYLQGSYVWIFPIRNALWYPKGKLEQYLKDSFKRIDTIDISLENSHTLLVTITERKPFAIWCEKAMVNTEDEHCYFMDNTSTIFAPAPNFSGDAYFKYYGSVEGETPIGQFFMSSTTEFMGIVDLIASADKLSLRPQYLLSRGVGEYALVISGGGEIRFDTREPLSITIENLEALLRNSIFSTSTTKDLPIDYIDLRFGNKLFYKLKGQ